MAWVKVVDVEAVVDAVVARAEVAARGQGRWGGPSLPGRVAIASAPIVDIGSRTRRACPATRSSALNVACR